MSAFDEHILTFNFPPYSISRDIIQDILDGTEYQSVISNEPGAESQIISGIKVSNDFVEKGINAEYLSTSIVGKHVFAPRPRGSVGLPCHLSEPYIVQDSADFTDTSDYSYTEVQFDDEQTLADLYKNAWKYRYEEYLDKYVRLPEQGAKQQLAKQVLAKEIAYIYGNPYERLADYGRVILFLLSKIVLTEEEQTQLGPLLSYAPALSSLDEVLYREEKIQEKVASMKEDFNAYIGIGSES